MAKRIVLVDDMDPTGRTEAAETVGFALDGIAYQIDLSEGNAKSLREALAPFIDNAQVDRSETPRGRTARAQGRPSGAGRSSHIREWARKNGYEVGENGALPRHVKEAYEAQAGTAPQTRTTVPIDAREMAKTKAGAGEIRAWAKREGFPLGPRLSNKILDAYAASHATV